jgi:hypothetical protein
MTVHSPVKASNKKWWVSDKKDLLIQINMVKPVLRFHLRNKEKVVF